MARTVSRHFRHRARLTSSAPPAWGRRWWRWARGETGLGEGQPRTAGGELLRDAAERKTREIALRPDEILTEIVVPRPGAHNATYEVRQKRRWIGLWRGVVALTMKGTAVASAKVVLGHVAPTPWSPEATAGKERGREDDYNRRAEAAGKAAAEGAKPLSGKILTK